MEELRLLLIGDIHYGGSPSRESKIAGRKSKFGVEFLKRLGNRISPGDYDAAVFMGDLVDDGLAEGAAEDLGAIKKEADSFPVPCFFVRGNHDPEETVFRKLTGMEADCAVLGGYLLYFFHDRYSEGDYCIRRERDISGFLEAVKTHPGKKIIAFQHNPLFPEIEGEYPYNLVKAEDVHGVYSSGEVIISVSGHYHKGLDVFHKEGISYLTVPALCEFPFSFVELGIKGSDIRVSRKTLAPEGLSWDNHCHSEFAYCGEDVSVEAVCERARLLGLEYVAFAEHAGQLYLPRENYWAGDCYSCPGLIREYRENGLDRMAGYKSRIKEFGGGIARPGLEVEADKNGDLTLLDEDREGVEILLGAVHFLPEAGKAETEKLFMKANEALLRNGVDVIAHPFRFFRRAKTPAPRHLFRELALMLKDYGAAAEVNFHTNEPPVEFFEICASEVVRISIGTDTHNLCEAGDLSRHIEFMRKLGISPGRDREMFFRV